MIKVQITKNNIVTNEANFASQLLANAWVQTESANGSFGKLERWVLYGQEDVSSAIETREITINGSMAMQYRLPSDFVVTQEDFTEEINKEIEKQAKIEAGRKARETCQSVLDYIAGANLDKALTIEQITEMQATYANAESALRAGRPTYAKMFISAIVPDGVIVTATEKASCLSILSGY